MCLIKFTILLLVFVNFLNGDEDYKILPFTVTVPSGNPTCYSDEIELKTSDKFRITVHSNNNSPVAGGKCYICNKSECDDSSRLLLLPAFADLEPVTSGNKMALTSAVFNLSKMIPHFNQANMNEKTLVCYVGLANNNDALLNNNNVEETITLKKTNYYRVDCFMKLHLVLNEPSSIFNSFITWCVVGGIVLLIIVGQTIALLRCHIKAKARYSAAPSLRTVKPNRAEADTDSHIYETVNVNALYRDSDESEIKEVDIRNRPPLPLPGNSSELDIKEMDIINRPALPLPGQTPDPAPPVHTETPPRPLKKLAMSSLSLNRSSRATQVMAAKPSKNLPNPEITPTRPPKPDENSLPGSLKRPPKPDENSLPGSLKRPPKPLPKSGSLPKIIAKDPGLMELKNALKKRNPEMASSNSSPVATLEKKQPPQAPKKPPPKQIVQPMPKPQPTNQPLPPIEPSTIPPSHIKAKLEATLKGMNPMGLKPQASDVVSPNVSHLRPNPTGVSVAGPSNLSPARNSTLVRSNLPVATVLPLKAASPPVSRQLPPTPNLASRPLPPIQQEEDLVESDDEEWTYEPLEQFNLYNV